MGLFSIFKKKPSAATPIKAPEVKKVSEVKKKKKADVEKSESKDLVSAKGGSVFGRKTSKEKEKVDKKGKKPSFAKATDGRDLTISEITGQERVKKGGKSVKKHVAKHDTKQAYKVLIRPLITEKASYLKAENKYLFEVNKFANKNEIKKAVFHVYGIWPENIHIINLRGKEIRYGRSSGITKSRKKAIVTLKQGDNIEIYEGV